MNTLPPRDLISEQRQALIDALKRFGYTYDAFDAYDEAAKPYYVYVEYSALVIIHGLCMGCSFDGLYSHDAEFLKAMIPVIGRLDACAKFDPGYSVRAPRLRIHL